MGIRSIAIASLLPPPVPMVPFVIAAGATQYSTNKFLAALTLGRAVRYSILALLAAHYGRQIIGYVTHHGHPYWYAGIAAVIIIGIILFVCFPHEKKVGVSNFNKTFGLFCCVAPTQYRPRPVSFFAWRFKVKLIRFNAEATIF